MRLVAGPSLAHAVSQAGGVGFIGAGSDVSNLKELLLEAEHLQNKSPISKVPVDTLPIGIGFLNWGVDLETVVSVLMDAKLKPAAVWYFAPKIEEDLATWTTAIREATNQKTKIWIQVGTVKSAVGITTTCSPDVLIIQGNDAGGHGLAHSSSIISLLPEVSDALAAQTKPKSMATPLIAAGGIMDGRGVAAAIMLGAQGVCMGTRFLVSDEAQIAQGYKQSVLAAEDGGVSTVRSKVYDTLRGTTSWPETYNGRGIINKSYRDWVEGMNETENKKLYDEAGKLGDKGWGKEEGRMATYAGTGVGLAKNIQPAGEIVEEVLKEVRDLMVKGGSS